LKSQAMLYSVIYFLIFITNTNLTVYRVVPFTPDGRSTGS